MKTLIINGSPRKNGYCAAVADHIANHADCEVINCFFENIAHCTGCDSCKSGNCIIDDKMQGFYKKISEAEKIIIISPLYFSMLTGALLTFASRFQYFYHNPIKKQKKGAVILIGGGSTKDTTKAFSTARIILRYVGIQHPEESAFVGTDTKDPLKDNDFKIKLEKLIRNLNK